MAEDWSKGYKSGYRPFISILDKMIAQDLLKTLTSVLTVIVVIIVSRKFIRILDKAIEGQVSNEILLSILGLKTVIACVTFLPAAIFMAVLMVLGRMYRDQEMAAVASAGGGAGVMYRAVFVLVLPLSIFATGLSTYVAPWAEARVGQLMQQDEESADLRGIAAGKFSEYSQGDLVVYVEKISDDKKMHGVFVQNRQHGTLGIINAKTGHLEDLPTGRYMVLEQGERIQGHPGALNYVLEQFDEYSVRVDSKVAADSFIQESIATEVLLKSAARRDIAELQRRLFIPLGIMLLSFIAVPLAQMSPRSGVYGNMLVGFLIYFSYGNLVNVSQSWVIKGTIPVWLGAVGVNLLLFIMGSILLARLYGWQWLRATLKSKVTK
ncbi:MAG: LPS export ABC transporter permease LptF [Methylococcales bacterium]|nr:LPS export ABC transporter permease LptF [Methylococcales bacterium]